MEPTLKNLLSYALTYFSLLFHGPKIHPFHYQLLAPSSPEILNQDVFSDKFESTVVLMNATIYPDTLKKDQTQEQMSEKLRKLFEEEVLMWKAKAENRTENIVFMPVITVNKTKFDTEQLLQQIRADYNTVKAFVRQFLEESRKHKIPVSNVIISIYGWNNECGIKGMESCRQREIMTRKIFNDLEIKTQRANGTIYFVGDQLWNDISLRTLIHLKGGNDPSTVI